MTLQSPSFFSRLMAGSKSLFQDAGRTSYDLFKIMVPLSILTRILNDVGLTAYLGHFLEPVMAVMGLPGSMGLVWATAMLTNLYGAMVVFASLAPDAGLTVAQVTVLTTIMLVAHGLPVELGITRRAGPRLRAMAVVRVGGALIMGWALNALYAAGGLLQMPNDAVWNPPPPDPSWVHWARGEAVNLVYIFFIIILLLLVMKGLKVLGITDLLTRLLAPVLSGLGMSPAAAPITVIGMTLGVAYGGGLIIREARSGRISNHDIFYSLALMSLSHGLIEDTLLMMVLGGHWSGILFFRLAASILLIFLVVRIVRRLPAAVFNRFFFRKPLLEQRPDR